MQYINKDLGSFRLHLIKTDKFKTVTMRVVFHTPIKKEEITKRNILTDILLQSSKEYETRRDLTIKAEELYAADITTNNQRVGNYIVSSFILQALNDKYTEAGNLELAIEFLSEIIFNPDVNDKKFRSTKLELVKNNAKVALNSIKEDASGYCLMRLAEAFDKNSPISYRMTGYLEDLDAITEESLYNHYQDMIANDLVDIFIVGDFEASEMTQIIKKYFKFKKLKKEKASYYLDVRKCNNRRLFAKETIENTQSKLAIACPVAKLTDYERNYPLLLANLILGGGTDSKLFKDVREKNSLCYTVHSFFNKLDNLLIITAGIDKSNYQKTVDLITKNLNDLKKGKFSEKDIATAKEFYLNAQEEIEENEHRIINEYLSRELLKIAPAEERIEKIKNVTKQEIIKASKKIGMDTVFLLEGVKNEED